MRLGRPGPARRRGRGRSPQEQINLLAERITAAAMPSRAGCWRVAVMGPKGGSGKTPTAASLALNLASHRGELTAAVDANIHPGTLRLRLVPHDAATPLPMLAMANVAATGQLEASWPVLSRYCDLVERVRVFTNTGLDPALVEAMTGRQYLDFLTLLSRAAELVVEDLGTSTAGQVATAALDTADQLVLCTEMRRDALEVAMEWLSALGGKPLSYRREPEDYGSIADGRYRELAHRAIVVVAPGGGDPAALQGLLDWFAKMTKHGRDAGRVVLVPHDRHIAAGEQIRLGRLQPATQLAYLQVAAHVVDNFQLGPLGERHLPPRPRELPTLAVEAGARPPAPEPAAASQHRHDVPAPVRAAGGSRTAVAAAVRAQPEPVPDPEGARPGPRALASVRLPDPVAEPAPPPATPTTAGGATGGQRGSAGPTGLEAAALLALGRDLAGVLGVEHTEGEVCNGCGAQGCAWPKPPPSGAGERA